MARQDSKGRILVGIDQSPAAAAALRWAAAEARIRGMRLHVVHARDPQAVVPAHYAPSGAGQDAVSNAEGLALEALVREAARSGGWPTVHFEVVDGLPVRVLLERAPGAAMLVLGSTRSALLADSPVGKPRAPLGPVARDCLRAAPCPVVIVAEPSVQPDAEPVRAGTGPLPVSFFLLLTGLILAHLLLVEVAKARFYRVSRSTVPPATH
jgi:nucleotide-binding universal stress UspA family protein